MDMEAVKNREKGSKKERKKEGRNKKENTEKIEELFLL